MFELFSHVCIDESSEQGICTFLLKCKEKLQIWQDQIAEMADLIKRLIQKFNFYLIYTNISWIMNILC